MRGRSVGVAGRMVTDDMVGVGGGQLGSWVVGEGGKGDDELGG